MGQKARTRKTAKVTRRRRTLTPKQRQARFGEWLSIPEAAQTKFFDKLWAEARRSTAAQQEREPGPPRTLDSADGATRLTTWDPVVLPCFGTRRDGSAVSDPIVDARETPATWDLPRGIPEPLRSLLYSLTPTARTELTEEWLQYLAGAGPEPGPIGKQFGLQVSKQGPLDVIVWAHSDSDGGTELAACIATQIRRVDSKQRVAVATPSPDIVGKRFPGVQTLATEILARPIKIDGGVDVRNTHVKFLELFDSATFEHFKGKLADSFRSVVKPNRTLFISVGEPLAMAVADAWGCPAIIVTDHLIARTMKDILRGMPRVGKMLKELEQLDCSARAAFLAPVEFTSASYSTHLEDLGVSPLLLRGLLYAEPEGGVDKALAKRVGNRRLVIVHPGGGTVWLGSVGKITEWWKRGECEHVLLVRQESGTWSLYEPGERKPEPFPGSRQLTSWYALSDLVVGRGGLVAQQVLACARAGVGCTPSLLFIEERDHPLVREQQSTLRRHQLVHSASLYDFTHDPVGAIESALGERTPSWITQYRDRLNLHYGAPVLPDLAKIILKRDWNAPGAP